MRDQAKSMPGSSAGTADTKHTNIRAQQKLLKCRHFLWEQEAALFALSSSHDKAPPEARSWGRFGLWPILNYSGFHAQGSRLWGQSILCTPTWAPSCCP